MAASDEKETLADRLSRALSWYSGELPATQESVIGDLVYLYARSRTFCRLIDELLATDLKEDSRDKLAEQLWRLSAEVDSIDGTCRDLRKTFNQVIEKGYRTP
ncbi:MAG TPA: hypothetical protein VEK15_31285 [Vicinamibacteria bacterium]|nr:hypothetical protein [Vicinamibacteria bacterium]